MDVTAIGVIVLVFVFILMFLRIPIVVAMAVPACIGILFLKSENALFTAIESIIWHHSYSYTLSTIPLFVLMGQFLYVAGFSDELYTAFKNWFGKLKGGLGIATIGASAMFAASSGSSLATTGTIGVVASKEMLKAGYSKSLTGGSIVAGGTLGILIPPSTMFILYGMMTEQSIGKLLMAGIVPGILLTLFFMLTIWISILIKPSLVSGTYENNVPWSEKVKSLKTNVWIILLFILVMGGIYIGFFTATEAAGFGALGAFLVALLRKKLTFARFREAIFSTVKTTGFIFAIVMGAFLLNFILTITRVPNLLADFLFSKELSPTMIFLLIVLMYLILGAIMDTMAMIVVTIPIIMPIIQALEFDLIWFGVIIVLLVEMALISPPVGMNCFVLKGVVDDLDLQSIFKGALLFMIPILSLIILLYIFPEIALFLPNYVR
ncbi:MULTISPECIES: TRAP transporter large permease [Cytobacillus]|uniref:TRAP transporter large permease n=1 Tax=Cytobacillus stercorigallinarum TaxID=2762240 RepID=A0ABR8QLI3_9BACI|nr:TRAP transporter large permease [Cytobacillus stercorigallinarum]MBD7936369.1 TRAP transporter large permease [Cytobacillus stercorigallinarum]